MLLHAAVHDYLIDTSALAERTYVVAGSLLSRSLYLQYYKVTQKYSIVVQLPVQPYHGFPCNDFSRSLCYVEATTMPRVNDTFSRVITRVMSWSCLISIYTSLSRVIKNLHWKFWHIIACNHACVKLLCVCVLLNFLFEGFFNGMCRDKTVPYHVNAFANIFETLISPFTRARQNF